LLSTSRLTRIDAVGRDRVRVQAGVTLVDLDAALAAAGRYYPPAPTFTGAFVGGTVATNAAGAATFKYGTTREWVLALTVVLPNGEVLDIERGGTRAGAEGALAFVRRLRDAARTAWRTGDPAGLDISAIEHMDARCLALLRQDGIDRLHAVPIPDRAAIALLVTLELPPGTTAAEAYDQIGCARETACDAPLTRLCRELETAGVLGDVQLAVPGDRGRMAQLLAIREAVPAAVNARVGRAKQTIDARIAKTAADMIVPFEQLSELLAIYDAEFESRGLDAAVWGHISDGNLHPNVIPRSMADVESGKEAILAFGREVQRLGGSPLAEHGVGRNAVKQQLLLNLYGRDGIEQMRAVKRALDPEWKLAPGVIFGKT